MDFQKELDLLEAVDKEARRLLVLGYHNALKMDASRFLMAMTALKNQLGQFLQNNEIDEFKPIGEIPLLVAFPNSMLNYQTQLQLMRFDSQFCHIWLDRFNIPAFAEMHEYSRPEPHLILDVEINGQNMPKEYSPIRAEAALRLQGRRGLSFSEGLALLGILNNRKETPPRSHLVLTNIFCSKNDDATITMPCLDFATSAVTPVITTVPANQANARNNIVSCRKDFIAYR